MKCIYCLEHRDNSCFTKAEHVIPRSFGNFQNNLTLHGIVCDECNQYFGDNLELHLARDTFEGIARFEHGVKQPTEFKSAGKQSRVKIQVQEGPYAGAYAYLEYSPEQGKIVLKPIPQVGFLKRCSSAYEFFSLDAIPEKAVFDQGDYDVKNPGCIRVLACDCQTAKKALEEKGIGFSRYGGETTRPEPDAGKWDCELQGRIDDVIRRAVAKIAFNYLAKWEERDFVLRKAFNPIRRFIRFGEKVDYPLVEDAQESILADEASADQRRLGHIVTVNWASDKTSIVAQVSLFNRLKYSISLAREYHGKRRGNITKGHFFNINDMTIIELTCGKR